MLSMSKQTIYLPFSINNGINVALRHAQHDINSIIAYALTKPTCTNTALHHR